MKPLKYQISAESHQYMRMRKEQNLARIPRLKAENWFCSEYLGTLPNERRFKFSRQASWGYRLFDFWFHDRGVAIEVDGPEHDAGYDAYRDKYNFLRSGIVVIRVRNFNESDAAEAMAHLRQECSWDDRRIAMGNVTAGSSKWAVHELARNGDWQEALRRLDEAGLYCSYGKPTGPSIQPRLL